MHIGPVSFIGRISCQAIIAGFRFLTVVTSVFLAFSVSGCSTYFYSCQVIGSVRHSCE